MTTVTDNLAQLLPTICAIAIQAGKKTLPHWRTDLQIDTKSDDSPLTAADLASHNHIVDALSALTPEIPILSEESAKIPTETRLGWKTFWLVDPLDGTKEFIKGTDEFTVNIALIHNHRPILGVVNAPASGTSWYAAEGVGCFKQLADEPAESIRVKTPAESPLNVVGSRSHGSGPTQAFIDRLGDSDLVVSGSSIKFCLVAEGKADVYPRLGPTSEWDTAAAQCVVEQAGGQVTKTDMNPLRYNQRDTLLNPYFLVFGDAEYDWAAALPEDV